MSAAELAFTIGLALFSVWFGFQIGAMWGLWTANVRRRQRRL